MTEINDMERKLLIEFRKRIADLEMPELAWHDMSLARWLRAQSHNLKKAEDMIRKSQQWKHENDIENLKNWRPPAEYLSKFCYKICGYDTEDSPIAICRFGEWDVRTEIEAGNRELYLKYLQWISVTFLEHMKELMKEKNKFISQLIIIFDLDGFSFRQISSIATVESYLEALRQYENNYPESLKAAYIININKYFGIGFNLMKPLLSARTISKLTAYDRSSEKWKAIITSSKFKLDPTIFAYEANEFNQDEDFETTTISAGDKLKFDVEVTEVGSTLNWKFKTDAHDIAFGISFRGPSSGSVIRPIERLPAATKMQQGSFKCQDIGKHTFVFDNSYSRLRSKTLHFSVGLQNSAN